MISGNVPINSQHILPPVGNTVNMPNAGFASREVKPRVNVDTLSERKKDTEVQDGDENYPAILLAQRARDIIPDENRAIDVV